MADNLNLGFHILWIIFVILFLTAVFAKIAYDFPIVVGILISLVILCYGIGWVTRKLVSPKKIKNWGY